MSPLACGVDSSTVLVILNAETSQRLVMYVTADVGGRESSIVFLHVNNESTHDFLYTLSVTEPHLLTGSTVYNLAPDILTAICCHYRL